MLQRLRQEAEMDLREIFRRFWLYRRVRSEIPASLYLNLVAKTLILFVYYSFKE